MTIRFLACLTLLLAGEVLGGCSSSFGGGGSEPARTYVVMPNGVAVPAQTMSRPPE